MIFLYEFKLGRSAQQAAKKKIYSEFGTGMANERTIHRWLVKFRSGDTTLQNESHGHRPTCSDELLRNTVEADPWENDRAITDELGIHHTTVSRRLRAIGKVKKLDSLVPHELTPANKNRRLEVCRSLSVRNKREKYPALDCHFR